MRVIKLLLLFQFLYLPVLLANRDSVGVKQVNNKWFILHKVDKGMGLYTIAKRYGVSMQNILDANPEASKGIDPGQMLLIPYNKPVKTIPIKDNTTSASSVKKENEKAGPQVPAPEKTESTGKDAVSTIKVTSDGREALYHTVVPGETLFHIAQEFKVSVDDIRQWNGLKNNALSAGKQLIVGYTAGSEKTEKESDFADGKLQKEYDDYQKLIELNKKKGKVEQKEVEESAVATAIDDGSIMTEKNLALHKTAAPGTIMQLTNPMNGNTVYVKVVGNIPKNISEENVSLKITKTAADKLGVKDKYFRLETHYVEEVIKK